MLETTQFFTVFNPFTEEEYDVAFKIYSDDTKHEAIYIGFTGTMAHQIGSFKDYEDCIKNCANFLRKIGFKVL